MTPEENKKRAEDEHVKYIKDHLCDRASKNKKPFVFISYKSDDWETVLHDIVYRLVKEYGLHVYFDGSFDVHNDVWIKQFPENMEHYLCRGVLAFVDDKYVTSYATLLELMYSQTAAVEKKVVQVNLGKLTSFDKTEEGGHDTGLGVETFEDNTKNMNVEAETELFNDTFSELKEGGILKKTQFLYKPGKRLTKKKCSKIAVDLLGYLKINENPYHGPNGSLEGIAGSIRDAFGDEVFEEIHIRPSEQVTVSFQNDGDRQDVRVEKGHTIQEPAAPSKDGYKFKGWYSVIQDAEIRWNFQTDKAGEDIVLYARWEKIVSSDGSPKSGRISLNDFFKNYNNSNFNMNTYLKFRLVGTDGYEKYSTEYAQSAYGLAWEFVMKLLAERGVSYIQEVTEKHSGLKFPVFISQDDYDGRGADKKKYRQISVPGLEQYYMYRHHGQYNWLDSALRPRLTEFGLPIDKFYFEYVSENDSLPPVSQPTKGDDGGKTGKKGGSTKPGEITGPITVGGQESVETVAGSYILEDFLAKYSNKTFQSTSCKSIKLIGVNGCEGYSADKNAEGKPLQSARRLVFHFAMARIDEMGTKYIETVNNANKDLKNPIFITREEHQIKKARKESVTYTAVTSQAGEGYSMCTHYSEYDWLRNSLVKQLRALGLDLKDFRLEFE